MSKESAEVLDDSEVSKNKVIKTLNEIEASILKTCQDVLPSPKNHTLANSYLPKVLDELDLVLMTTEEATKQILCAAEKIENLASWTDASTASELSQTVTQIYEACNFQDLAGQRIAKVIRAFHDIEIKIQHMLQELGGTSCLSEDHIKKIFEHRRTEAKDLLAGPQKSGEGKSQCEIDDMFKH